MISLTASLVNKLPDLSESKNATIVELSEATLIWNLTLKLIEIEMDNVLKCVYVSHWYNNEIDLKFLLILCIYEFMY